MAMKVLFITSAVLLLSCIQPAMVFHLAYTWFEPHDFRWWFMVVPAVQLFLLGPIISLVVCYSFFLTWIREIS